MGGVASESSIDGKESAEQSTRHMKHCSLQFNPYTPDPNEPVVGEGDTELERLALSVSKG